MYRVSLVRIDILTLVIGTMYFDLMLYSPFDLSYEVGRISFKAESLQQSEIEAIANDVNIVLYNQDVKNEKNIYQNICISVTDEKKKKKLEEGTKNENTIFYPKMPIKNPNSKNDNKINSSSIIYKNTGQIILKKQLISIDIIKNDNHYPFIVGKKQNSDSYEIIGYYKVKIKDVLQEIKQKILKQLMDIYEMALKLKDISNLKEFNYYLTSDYSGKKEENVYWNGEIVGKVSFNLSIKNIPLIIQLKYCIFTEKGLTVNSYSIYSYLNCPNTSNAIFKNISSELVRTYNNLQDAISSSEEERKTDPNFKYHISYDLSHIKNLFEASVSNEIFLYKYNTKSELLDAQELFLQIGMAIYEIIYYLESDDVLVAFDIIQVINERFEFNQTILANYWLDNTYGDDDNYEFSEQVIDRKLVETLLKFNIKSFDLLKKSNRKSSIDTEEFNRKFSFTGYINGVSSNDNYEYKIPETRLYLNKLMAYSFFKFPYARKLLIKSVFNNFKTSDIKEYLAYDNKEQIDKYPSSKALYWDQFISKKFFIGVKNLKNEDPEIQKLVNLTSELINENENPFPELSNRKEFGFDLIRNIIELTVKKLSKFENDINWLTISQFPDLINAIFCEVSSKTFKEYPSNLCEIILLFINNSKIINKFLEIVIKKTNVYDTVAVFFLFDFLDKLNEENERRHLFNYDLDYILLLKAFKIICSIENSLNISKMLWFYYKNSHLMPNYHLIEITCEIFYPKFFNFFFHWSWKIRKLWQDFLIYILLFRLNDKIKYSEICYDDTNKNADKKFSNYFDQYMDIINKMVQIFQENNNKFNLLDESNVKLIKDFIGKKDWSNIEWTLEEYISSMKEFNRWRKRNENGERLDYPIISIPPIIDDVDN